MSIDFSALNIQKAYERLKKSVNNKGYPSSYITLGNLCDALEIQVVLYEGIPSAVCDDCTRLYDILVDLKMVSTNDEFLC